MQTLGDGAVWGNITGTITNQTDLLAYLAANYYPLVGNPAGYLTSAVTSVGLVMPSAFTVTNSPVTTTGDLTVTGAGSVSQYIRGDGTLADFPGTGGGSSVNYYLNGSINQGVISGNTYYQMSKTPVVGTGTDFSIAANGYIAEFITDANDPSLLNIPSGSWNVQLYMSANSAGGSPSFYLELYKYDGATFTLIADSSATPEFITGGTSIDLYYTSIAVPATTLAITDRLAIRVYVNNSGRTITLHTEDTHFCQVITTFTTGITAINSLTAQVQFLATGTTGTDFNIVSSGATHTFNLPTASSTKRGALSSADWTVFNSKQNAISLTTLGSSGASTFISDVLNIPNYTLSGLGGVPTSRTLTINGTAYDLSADRTWSVGTVTSVAALTLGTTGTDLSSTVATGTTTPVITLNVPTASAVNRGALSSTDWSTFNAKQDVISLTTLGSSGASTFIGNTLNVPNYTLSGLGGVPTSRTLTINGTTYDLSADRTWNVGTLTGSGTTNYVPRWTGASALGDSVIYNSGSKVAVGHTSADGLLDSRYTGTWSSGNFISLTGVSFPTFNANTSIGTVLISGTAASLAATYNGNATVGNGGRTNALDAIATFATPNGGTVTATQAATIRALSAITAATYFNAGAASTITHVASIRTLSDINSGGSTLNITNRYGVLVGNLTPLAGSITYTNRWGIYQEGASDINYFASSILVGTTTNAGYKVDIVGSLRSSGEVTINTINNLGVATTAILVSDSGTIKYRTPAQLVSDLNINVLVQYQIYNTFRL